MKSSLLGHNIAVLVETYGEYLHVYYADKHNEVLASIIPDYQIYDEYIGYKKPIIIQNNLLYPTMNCKHQFCRWINLEYLEENDLFFFSLLKTKSLFEIAKKMYIREKRKQIQ